MVNSVFVSHQDLAKRILLRKTSVFYPHHRTQGAPFAIRNSVVLLRTVENYHQTVAREQHIPASSLASKPRAREMGENLV